MGFKGAKSEQENKAASRASEGKDQRALMVERKYAQFRFMIPSNS